MSDLPPLYLNRPRAISTYTNKYAPGNALNSFLSSLYPSTTNALKTFDVARANVGRPPLTKEETKFAGTAVNEQRAAAPTPDQPWWRDAISDVGTVLGEVPKLPFTLVKEGQRIAQLPEAIGNLPEADNPLEAVGNIAQLPGIRLIPGSFTASQFGTGGAGVGGLTEHPVLTALDVLPYATRGAKFTKTVKAAEDVAQRAAEAEGAIPRRVSPFSSLARYGRPSGPIETVRPSPIAPNIEIPSLEPNLLGRTLERTGGSLATTAPGNMVKQAFGKLSREDARVRNRIGGEVNLTTAERPLGPFTDELSGVAATARDQAHELAAQRANLVKDLGQDRVFTVEQIGRVGTPEDIARLTTPELEYLKSARDLNEPIRQELVKTGELAERDIAGTTETYDNPTARRLDTARRLRDTQLAAAHLQDILDPTTATTATRDAIVADLEVMLKDRNITKPRPVLVRSYLRALDNQGYDVYAARQAVKNSKWNEVIERIPDAPTREVAPELIERGSKAAIRSLERQGFRKGKLNQSLRVVDRAETTAVPARLEEAVRTELDNRITSELNARYSGPELDRAMELASRRLYPQLEEYLPEIQKFRTDARASWQDLRARGYDPVFQHRVHPSQAGRFDFPKIVSYVPSLGQVKARLWDAQPIISDYSISLHDRAMEILIRNGRQAYVDDFLTPNMARDTTSLINQYLPAAQRAGQDVEALIRKDWSPYNPDSYINGRANVQTLGGKPKYWIPRDLARNLERLQAAPSDIGRLIDKPMKLFRTSVLPLSPRWHLYNTLGGAILQSARARNPIGIVFNFRDALKMMSEGGVEGIASREGLTAAEREAARLAPAQGTRAGLEWFVGDNMPKGDAGKLSVVNNTLAGSKMDSLLRSAWDAGATKGIRKGFNWTTAKSYFVNQWVDDFYRVSTYLDESKHALKKGATSEEAIRAGIKAARETLQNWDTLTPLERSTLRYIFPFYSWTRTVLRYTLTYPVDHPWRTSILANLANTELQDFNTGLPQRLRNLLFLGDQDENGNVTAINLDGANPFRDVANYFTLAGFLNGDGDVGAITSQLNPFISTAMQWAGVDTTRGIPELFPEMKFNPDTGTVDPIPKGNPLQTAVGNFIPQVRALGGLLGANAEYKQLAQSDPKAAGRYLASAVGIPVLRRDVNVPRETINAELTRYHSLRDDINASLKSGSTGSLVQRYPGLQAFQQRLAALSPQQQARYRPQPGLPGSYQPGWQELFKEAVSSGVPRP